MSSSQAGMKNIPSRSCTQTNVQLSKLDRRPVDSIMADYSSLDDGTHAFYSSIKSKEVLDASTAKTIEQSVESYIQSTVLDDDGKQVDPARRKLMDQYSAPYLTLDDVS